jgi:hypothetical protein
MGSARSSAAINNAEWCDVVCRTHGVDTRFDEAAWTSRTRTPPYYPDAVTLVADPSVPDLLDRIDTSPGCSIKDSFASLDLTTNGFRVLFDADWIVRTPTARGREASSAGWTIVRDLDAFSRWEQAWRGVDGPPGVLRSDLLGYESVAVLVAREGDRVVAGAVLNRSAEVVGISNFFAAPDIAAVSWDGCVAFASTLFPGSTFVGYAAGVELAMALAGGFESAGPLRVWVRDG